MVVRNRQSSNHADLRSPNGVIQHKLASETWVYGASQHHCDHADSSRVESVLRLRRCTASNRRQPPRYSLLASRRKALVLLRRVSPAAGGSRGHRSNSNAAVTPSQRSSVSPPAYRAASGEAALCAAVRRLAHAWPESDSHLSVGTARSLAHARLAPLTARRCRLIGAALIKRARDTAGYAS